MLHGDTQHKQVLVDYLSELRDAETANSILSHLPPDRRAATYQLTGWINSLPNQQFTQLTCLQARRSLACSPFCSRTANVTRVPSGKSVVRRRTSCSVLPANDANTRWRSDNTSTARQVGDTVGEGAKRLDVEPHGRVARPDEVTQTHLASLN